MEDEWQTYGFAGVLLPNGGIKLVNFHGTQREAQDQVDAAAKEYGGVAPNLKSSQQRDINLMNEQIACRIFNEGFDD